MPVTAHPCTCVIADGNAVLREGLRVALARTPAVRLVGEARDGDEAVALAARLRPEVVLLDPVLPGLDGLEATRRIRAAHPSCRVVLFSQLASPAVVERGRAAGASGFVVKDSGIATIARAIAIVRCGGEFVDPQLADGGELDLAA